MNDTTDILEERMQPMDALRAVCIKTGRMYKEISLDSGRNPKFLSALFSRPDSDVYCGTMALIGETCGYTLCLVPNESVTRNAIVIEKKEQQ